MTKTKKLELNNSSTKEKESNLRFSINTMIKIATDIISIAISKSIINVTNYIEPLVKTSIIMADKELSKDDVITVQNLFIKIISDIIINITPEHWGYDFIDINKSEIKNYILSVCNKEKIIVPLKGDIGYESLSCDFFNFEFILKEVRQINLLTDELIENKQIVEVEKEVQLPPPPYKANINDWYYLYGGKKQLEEFIKSWEGYNVYIGTKGELLGCHREADYTGQLTGWKFNKDEQDELLEILENDETFTYDVGFDDTQEFIEIEGEV